MHFLARRLAVVPEIRQTNGDGIELLTLLGLRATMYSAVRECGDSEMASGWAKDGAVQEQIDASVAEAVKLARSRISDGESLVDCEDCGDTIPEARREAVPGVRRCVACQESFDEEQHRSGAINRRGSKDSQLR